jgi:hypothetical protein
VEGVERGLVAHGWASKPNAGPAVHRHDAADPKLIQLFVPPSDVKGGSEKLPKDSAEQAAEKNVLLEVVN